MCQNESSCFELAHATSVGPKQFSQQALSLDNRHEAGHHSRREIRLMQGSLRLALHCRKPAEFCAGKGSQA